MIDLPEGPFQDHWETKHIRRETVEEVLSYFKIHHFAAVALTECIDEEYGTGPGKLMEDMFSIQGGWPRALNDWARVSRLEEATLLLRRFRDLGVVEFGCLQDDDQGYLRGRGYWLSTFGKAVLMEMRDQNIDPWDKILL